MNDQLELDQERGVLRWGGLAGIVGGILFILAFVVVIVGPVGIEDPADLASWITRFPDIKAARIVENVTYLLALILEIPLFLALYRALRKTSLAPALFGSVLGIVGLTVMVVGATPHVAHAPLSDLYHAPGAAPADQATLALIWQATWGIFDAMLYVGFLVVPVGLGLLGVAMFGAPAFGKGFGVVTLVLGAAGLVAAILQMVDPASTIGAGSYFACLILYFVLGWKVYVVSRSELDVMRTGETEGAL
jgi:hypothetical protein